MQQVVELLGFAAHRPVRRYLRWRFHYFC